MKSVDFAIIGVGAAGLTAAYTLKGFNKKVLIIEKDRPGGACTITGCMPSKALINIGKDMKVLSEFINYKVDSEETMKKVKEVVEEIYNKNSEEVLKKEGFIYLKGEAKFRGEHIISVGEDIFYADTIIIATGSEPVVPKIEGLNRIEYLTNKTIFKLNELPKSIAIVGGGYIGVELAQALNRLGVKVKLIERNRRLISNEDKEISKRIKDILIDEGIEIYTGYSAVEFYNSNDNGLKNVNIVIENKREKQILKSEKVLIALGRKSCIDKLDLEKGNIKFNEAGVIVDSHLETSSPGVYAIGDCNGVYKFSNIANYEGILATQNSILPIQKNVSYDNIAWGIYTDPEIGNCGLSEDEAREKFGDSIRVYKEYFKDIDRAVTEDSKYGFIKMILDKKGKVLGCSVIGKNAAEIVATVQIIKINNINMAKIRKVLMPYPTYNEVLVKIGKRVFVDNLKMFNILK